MSKEKLEALLSPPFLSYHNNHCGCLGCVWIRNVKQALAELDKSDTLCKDDYNEWPYQTHIRSKTKAEHLEKIECLFQEFGENCKWVENEYEWRRAEEGLPEFGLRHLAYNPKWNPLVSIQIEAGELNRDDYTHWMLMPKPPRTDEVKQLQAENEMLTDALRNIQTYCPEGCTCDRCKIISKALKGGE